MLPKVLHSPSKDIRGRHGQGIACSLLSSGSYFAAVAPIVTQADIIDNLCLARKSTGTPLENSAGMLAAHSNIINSRKIERKFEKFGRDSNPQLF